MPHFKTASHTLTAMKVMTVLPLFLCAILLGGLASAPAAVFAQTPAVPTSGTPAAAPAAPTSGTPAAAPAVPAATTPVGTLANPLKFASLDDLLNGLLAAVIQLGTVILTLALIYTGFRFVEARGNDEKISKARTALMYTVIGGLIILGATAIKEVISSTVTSLQP